jgi:hypothetical protein
MMMKSDICEFKKCKDEATHIFKIGDVKTQYCKKHGELIEKVFRDNNIALLDKVLRQ